MSPAAGLTALARGAARYPRGTLAVAVLLALLGGALALTLRPTTATDTLVARSSSAFKATDRYHRQFGDDAVVVLVQEPLSTLLLGKDIDPLIGLEGCLSGNVPPNATPQGGARGPCGQIAAERATHLVFGPGTFLNSAASQITKQLGASAQQEQQTAQRDALAAYKLARAKGRSKAQATKLANSTQALEQQAFIKNLIAVGGQYGIGLQSLPEVHNTGFVSRIVFDPATRRPKARFSSLFPNEQNAIIQVRLNAGLSDSRRDRAIALIRQAAQMPVWRLQSGGYVVTGVPVIVADLSKSITNSLELLLIGALVVMALVLALVFRGRPRLLPLLVALLATAYTFGLLALSGASLTMASIGVLPVLIGLTVDYAIQFQSRVREEQAGGGGSGEQDEGAIRRAVSLGGPTIAVAGGATAGGFLILALPVVGSPVPMVRDFGVLLVLGVVIAVLTAFSAGTAAIVLAGRRAARPPSCAARPPSRPWQALAPSLRGAELLLIDNRLVRAVGGLVRRTASSVFEHVLRRPDRAVVLAGMLAILGWAGGTQTRVESDVQKLVPQSLPALQDLSILQRSTHVGGEIDVLVRAQDLTQPSVVAWMTGYQRRVEARFGGRGCGQSQLCPAFSLPDLFQTQGAPQQPTQADIRTLLDAVPPYFAQGVISPDRRTATLAFGIRLMALDQQKRVIDGLRADLQTPPGISAQLVGLPVLVADANAQIASPWRRLGTLLFGLLAVAVVLLGALRSRRRALVPLIPIALATGWSSLVLWAIQVPLNPMSVTLGALVIAISTEFSVLLSERYRQERRLGQPPRAALERTYRSTGAAVLASGATAIAGFGVLALSDINMLRNFGVSTVVDLSVSLLGVLLVLPAVLLLAERERAIAWRTILRPAAT